MSHKVNKVNSNGDTISIDMTVEIPKPKDFIIPEQPYFPGIINPERKGIGQPMRGTDVNLQDAVDYLNDWWETQEEVREPDELMAEWIAFRKGLRQLLNDNGVKTNPCWSEENIVNGFRELLNEKK